jgi:glutamate synthase domain-containing protein 2
MGGDVFGVLYPMIRYTTFALMIAGAAVSLAYYSWHPAIAIAFWIFAFLSIVGIYNILQTHHSILRNYPVIGLMRFFLESTRKEMRQYFVESDTDGTPFNRNKRSIVYQRAKRQLDKRPFGTILDVYQPGFEWLAHSLSPKHPDPSTFRITIGGPDCLQPYSASVFNISAMSFGALSANAIRALNRGAKMGGFAHDTGEGSISIHHRESGGDLIWELGSGYFGCRNEDGSFSAEKFQAQAKDPQVKMIEIKLSQGAKPGHGGVLQGAKVTAEIAEARGVKIGEDCVSPASHPAFSTPRGLIDFITTLRHLSGGKPVGFKLCIGDPVEFMAIARAMVDTGVTPDFIVVDGAEGGTGAAPLEFTDHIGMPLRDGLTLVHSTLVGLGLRDKIKIGAAGKITSAFDMVRVMALGADWCNAARGFMFAIGCIQSQSCHTDQCPVGVATQDKLRQRALVVPDKAERVKNFHDNTIEALAEVIGAAGLMHPSEIRPSQLHRRISPTETRNYAELYPVLPEKALLSGEVASTLHHAWERARSESFKPVAA